MIYRSYSSFRYGFATSTVLRALDGYEYWPANMVRANGFDDGIAIAKPITSMPFALSVDGLALGSTFLYDSYLSQRTDVTADQYLQVTEASGYTGSWLLDLTEMAREKFGLSPSAASVDVNEDQLIQALKHCAFYVKRQSDGAIQYLELLKATLADLT